MTGTLSWPGVDLVRMSRRRQGHRAPPASHQMLAVATKHPTLSISTGMEVASGSEKREVVLRRSLQSNCTPRAQFPWGQLAALPGRVQRDMMWTSLIPGTGNLSHYKMPTAFSFSSRRSPGGTSPYKHRLHKGETAAGRRLLCLLHRAGTARTSNQRHLGKTRQTRTARTGAGVPSAGTIPRDSSHILAHHSSSACRDLWGC